MLMMKMLTWMTFCPLKEPFGELVRQGHVLEILTSAAQKTD